MNRTFLGIGAAYGFLAVALGAFGAHVMKDRLDATMLDVWQTAAHYQLAHALALLAIAIVAAHTSSRKLVWAGWLFTVGIALFSGSLYALAVTGIKPLGAVTPFGGLCFLAGWLALLLTAIERPSPA